NFADVLDIDVLDRPRQRQVQARIERVRILAQGGDHRLLARCHLVQRAEAEPDQGDAAERVGKQRASARSLGHAEVRPARTAYPPLWAFRSAMLEQVFDVGAAPPALFRAAAGQPRIARSARLLLAGRRNRIGLTRSAGACPGFTLVTRGLAPGASLPGHRQCDPFVSPAETFHEPCYTEDERKKQGSGDIFAAPARHTR